MQSADRTFNPQGTGLAKAFTAIRSHEQKNRYVITGFILSALGFFVASIPMGTATMVIGPVLLRNQIKTWGYFFCFIGTAWAIGLLLLNFLDLVNARPVAIIPPVAPLYYWLKALLFGT